MEYIFGYFISHTHEINNEKVAHSPPRLFIAVFNSSPELTSEAKFTPPSRSRFVRGLSGCTNDIAAEMSRYLGPVPPARHKN